MTDTKIDNTRLEKLLDEFAKDREREKYAGIMEVLEKSMVFLPVMKPEGIDEDTQKAMQSGRPVRLPDRTKIMPCLLKKDGGGHILPVFSSVGQIPADKRSPALVALPFLTGVSMSMANRQSVECMVLNPFTHNVTIPPSVMEVAQKRMAAAKGAGAAGMTDQQLWQAVHNRVMLVSLPQYLFAHGQEGLRELQDREGDFLMRFYKDAYPRERKMPADCDADQFSVMALNVTDDMQITRVDLPAGANKKGMCYRVYAAFLRQAEAVRYYVFEKTDNGNYIGTVTPDGSHGLLEPVPDNGAEIEAVMALASKSGENSQ